ncbi:hypothetical protein GCM10022221_08560 [Actinocorallia aurea]
MEHDLVVFVPGFLGSSLRRDGRDLWAEGTERLLAPRPSAHALAELALPPGLGDEPPEARFALEADRLLAQPDTMPGLLSCGGYADLRAALGDLADGQYVPFPYDWRLSHRLNAALLGARVARELIRWRERVDAHYPDRPDEPKVVFVCHATGGLIAGHHLECADGRETTRTLVTLGTPQSGIVQAARVLSGHAVAEDGGLGATASVLNEVLRDFALGLPSLAQMLPTYEAVRVEGKTRPRKIDDRRHPLRGLPSAAVEDAFAFHRDFAAARQAHRRADADPRPPYGVYRVASTAYTTVELIGLSADGSRFVDVGGGIGDGTVPRTSALAGWAPDEAETIWIDHRNEDMASAAALGGMLAAIRKGAPPDGMLAGDERITLHVPDQALAGRPFEAAVLGFDLKERELRGFMWRAGRRDRRPIVFVDVGGRFQTELEAGPGKWIIEVTAARPSRTERRIITLHAH